MKKFILRFLLALLVVIILAGAVLYFFRDRWITDYTPTVEQIGEIDIRVRNDTSFVKTKMVIHNRSMIEISIDTMKYKVSMFDVNYLESEKFLDIHLPIYGNDTIDFDLKIPSGHILKDLKSQNKTNKS